MGNCNQCGYCCQWLHFWYNKEPNIVEYIKARGLEVIQESETLIEVRIKQPCLNLSYDNQISICKINETKPNICSRFPLSSMEFFKSNNLKIKCIGENCGYRNDYKDLI